MDPKTLSTVFSLDKYTEAKVPEQIYDVVFENETQLLGKLNGQEKCKDLMFPFSHTALKDVNIKHSKILLKPTNDFANEKEIREITLDFQDFKDVDWQPGDTIAILPNNSSECVNELLKLLELETKSDRVCTVKLSKLCTKKTAKVPTYIPTPTTPREVLRDCLNLKSVLKKTFLRCLAEYCSDDEEKRFLKCISSKEGSSFYNDYIISRGFVLIDILKLCPTCKPPLSLVIEHMSRLLPRPYSIANSPLKTKNEVTFIFSALAVNPGITTKLLKEKTSGESTSILIYIRESNYFRYTEDNYQENQILIAIGTGVSPFLGFLEHKEHMMNKNRENPGKTWLFVGATTQQSVVHRENLLNWQLENVLSNYVESFSRTPAARFRYVQDAFQENSKQLANLIMEPQTCIYLCADGGGISKSIESSLENILSKELGISETESIKLLKDFKNKRKYREDIWL